jgi:hypothetical protein
VFKNNKFQNALNSDGVAALTDWDFWVEPLFYLVCVLTILYLISLPFGYIKDNKD